MRFELIHLDSFGCLCDTTFNLSPGLNVFYGPNEAGKSTLQQAIWALLYGFYKSDRRLSAESQHLERFRPWGGGTYGGSLIYRLDTGRSYRIARNFGTTDPTTLVLEADTGRDVTNDFERGKLGRVAFASDHFGMSDEVFVNTCFVRQADLHKLAEAAHAITETIVNLAGTGSQDRSVSQALDLLETALREQVGSARARSKPLPQAQDRLEKLKRERELILERRSALEADYETRARLTAAREQIDHDVTRLKYLLAVRQRNLLSHRVGEIEGLLTRKAEQEAQSAGHGDADDILLAQRDTLTRLYQAWTTARDSQETAKRELEAPSASAAELNQRRQSLIDQQRPLEPARSIQLEQEPVIRRLHQAWRDGLRAAQQADEAVRRAQADVDAMAPVRERARPYEAILVVEPATLADSADRWAAANEESATSDSELEAANRDWQATSISLDAYEELKPRLGQMNPDALSTLKKREADVKQLEAQAGPQWLRIAGSLLVGIGTLAAIGGLVGAVLGILRRAPLASGAGLGALTVGGVGVALGLAELWLRRIRQARWKKASDELAAELQRWGCKIVAEVEAGYQTLLTSQAPYEHLLQMREAAMSKRLAVEQIESQVRSALSVSVSAKFSYADLESVRKLVQEIKVQLDQLLARENQRDDLVWAAQQKRGELMASEAALSQTLQQFRFGGEDLDREAERFYQLCENQHQLSQLDAQIAALDAKLEVHTSIERRFRSATAAVEAAQSDLKRALQPFGIESDAPEQAFRTLEARLHQAEAAQRIGNNVRALAREVQALLGGYTLNQLKQQQDSFALEAKIILAANPGYADLAAEEQPEDLQQQLEDMSQRKMTVTRDLATTEERLRMAESGQRSLVEVDEDIAETQASIGNLDFHRQALEAAIEHLQAAADEHHRNFLPRLNVTVGQSLSRVTGGRYTNVLIDHNDLQIRLQIPDRPEPITPDVLSRGAQEQIYLLLRLGLTELMSNGRERLPLILDDPLVNYDHDRLMRGLEFLADLSRQTQILLFTKDEATKTWFRSELASDPADTLHEL